MKGREVTEKSKNGLQKSKLFLIILIAFYKDMIGVVDKDREVDIVSVDFRKAFDSTSHNILADKPLLYRLYKRTVKLMENWVRVLWTVAQTSAGGQSPVAYPKD